jgi:hypothetical protein
MTARLGTTVSSIIATGTVFLGQALLLMGHLHNDDEPSNGLAVYFSVLEYYSTLLSY